MCTSPDALPLPFYRIRHPERSDSDAERQPAGGVEDAASSNSSGGSDGGSDEEDGNTGEAEGSAAAMELDGQAPGLMAVLALSCCGG